jgi:hypothetical protein
MSSYHLLNAVWIGIFPMLTVTLTIGIVFYIICCLNRIKLKCNEHCLNRNERKAKQINIRKNVNDFFDDDDDGYNDDKKTNECKELEFVNEKNINRIEQFESINNKQISSKTQGKKIRKLNNNSNQSDFKDKEKAIIYQNMKTDVNKSYMMPDRGTLTLHLKPHDNLHSLDLDKTSNSFDTNAGVLNHLGLSNSNLIGSSKSLHLYNNNNNNDFNNNNNFDKLKSKMIISECNIEQLVVEELNESPKSAYSKFRSLNRLACISLLIYIKY